MQYKPIPLHYKQKHITMKKQMKQIASYLSFWEV